MMANMRKKYSEQTNNKIGNYFTQLLMNKYILPSLILLFFVFTCAILGFKILSQFIIAYSTVGFLYILCINVLVSIASISIYHTIRTCLYGYKQVHSKKYTVLQLTCKEKHKNLIAYKCTLSDDREYKLYDKKQYNEIQKDGACDLIIISNEYGAKLWEIVVASTK